MAASSSQITAMLTYPPFPSDAIVILCWAANSLFAPALPVNDPTLLLPLAAGLLQPSGKAPLDQGPPADV